MQAVIASIKVGDRIVKLQETFLTANSEGVVVAIFANFVIADFSGYQIPLMFNDFSVINKEKT